MVGGKQRGVRGHCVTPVSSQDGGHWHQQSISLPGLSGPCCPPMATLRAVTAQPRHPRVPPRAAPGQGRAALSLSLQILSGYDITLVQEVRDADLSAVEKLMDQLNR